MFCQLLSFNIRYLFKQIDSADFVNFILSLSHTTLSVSLALRMCVCLCERVSVFPGIHIVKCRIVSHQRISHQQAAIVLARSCVQAKYNHSQRRSANRGKVLQLLCIDRCIAVQCRISNGQIRSNHSRSTFVSVSSSMHTQ